MHSKKYTLAAIILSFVAAITIDASTPKIKSFITQKDFENGEPRGVSINHYGEILLSPQIDELYKTELSFLWTTAIDANNNLYVAGGNEGKVFKIDQSGNASSIFQADEVQVYALAIDVNNLYVGSSPKGKVYKVPLNKKINAADAVFFDPEELYIWSLAVDKSNNLFVATGEKGNIYKVDQQGKGVLFFESQDVHVREILFDKNGNLIAGTANKGLVLKIDAAGKAFVLYDSPLIEITDLIIHDSGTIYAAATGDTPPGVTPVQRTTAKSNEDNQENATEIDEDEEIEFAIQPIAPAAAGQTGRQAGELYRINPEGTVLTFQTLKSERIYSIGADDSGNILIGAGDKGNIYSMNSNGDMTLLTKLDELQVTVISKDKSGRNYLTTSNSGKVYRLSNQTNATGYFMSEVVDTGVFSQWGSVNWEYKAENGASVSVQTRSGNAKEPDKTWSDWSAPYSQAEGSIITSPAARFIQLKAVLTSADNKHSPLLKELSFSYLQKNLAPRISQIYIHKPDEYYPEATEDGKSNAQVENDKRSGQNGYQNQSFGRKSQKKGFRSVSWVSYDENGDGQTFSVYYKGVDEQMWRSLVDNYSGIVYSWDSELMPDGRYLIKVKARDDVSNPPASVLESEKISQPFIIDNSGPEISDIAVKNSGNETIITFSTKDLLTSIETVEYGINADKWQLIYPIDGICDSKTERFELKIPQKTKGLVSIVVKARDAIGNVGFGKHNILP